MRSNLFSANCCWRVGGNELMHICPYSLVYNGVLWIGRTKGGGYSRDYESSDRSRGGGGGFRDDRGGYADRSQPDRNDRRGFGNNFDQEDRRSGSFRDRPRGDYGLSSTETPNSLVIANMLRT